MKQEKRQPKYDRTKGFPKRLFDLLGGENADRGEYAKLARAIGVSTAAISNYISGLTGVSADNLIAIANYFSVSTDYLLGLTDIPSADTNIKAIAEYTGLSSKSVEALHTMKNGSSKVFTPNHKGLEFINMFFETSYLNEDDFIKQALMNRPGILDKLNEMGLSIPKRPACGIFYDLYKLIRPIEKPFQTYDDSLVEYDTDHEDLEEWDFDGRSYYCLSKSDVVLATVERSIESFINDLRKAYNPACFDYDGNFVGYTTLERLKASTGDVE